METLQIDSNSEPKSSDKLSVVWWNILLDKSRSGYHGDDPEYIVPQLNRIPFQALTLKNLQTPLDVVGISEAHQNNGEQLARFVGQNAGNWFEHNKNKRKGEHIGMFGSKVETAESLDLGDDKLAVITHVGQVAIAAVHLRNQRRGSERAEQMKVVLEYLKDYDKAVVMGDFNALWFEKVRRMIRQQGFSSVFDAVGKDSPATFPSDAYRGVMLTSRQSKLLREGVGIDDIYVRGLNVKSACSFEGDSDHLGLHAEIVLPQSA